MSDPHIEPVSSENTRAIYLLTCTHKHVYGTDFITSLHYSEEEAEHHAGEVAQDHDYDPEEPEEYFEYEIEECQIDVTKLEKAKGKE